ncbi:MAG TPA: hypothetical protein VMB47_14505 [Candidatus Aquilonibacter sp.]|nr:hypothetical protein [Candidatus Aquilonibacter sp.]
MLGAVILGTGVILRSLILLRGWQSHIIATYFWFYGYVVAGLVGDTVVALALREGVHSYRAVYWAAQLSTLAFGCAVIFEIFRHVLKPYPGAEIFARSLLLVTFGLIFFSGLIYARVASAAAARTFIGLERDVRMAQVLFFVAILAVIFRYGLPIGRNMRGMISGYALYIGTSLLTLAFRAYAGLPFDSIWRVLQPLSSAVTLCIWLAALWAYHPNPAPSPRVALGSDYEELVAATRGGVTAVRSYLERSLRG